MGVDAGGEKRLKNYENDREELVKKFGDKVGMVCVHE